MSREEITLDQIKLRIFEAIRRDGPYSHNIISLRLSQAASMFGRAVANDIINEFNLASKGWSKVDEKKEGV